MSNKIDMIVWSKKRPLQLDYLLRSAEKYFKNMGECVVLYAYDCQKEWNLYQLIKKHNSWANFMPEDGFKSQIIGILRTMKEELILGNSDDNVFIRDVPEIKLLQTSVAYSMRLHPEVNYCYPARLAISNPFIKKIRLKTETTESEYAWDWRRPYSDGCWGYPHPCDSNVYRREYLLNLLQGLHFNNPGTMEDAMNRKRNGDFPLMQCGDSPCLINICNNRVQLTSQCPHGGTSANELMRKMEQGYRISMDTPIPKSTQCHILTEYKYEEFKW